MKVCVDEILKDLKGKKFDDKSTYRIIIENALLMGRPGKEIPDEEKKLRFKLAVKMTAVEVGELEFSASEIVLILRLVGELYTHSPLIFGRVCELFGELEAA